MNSDDHHTDHDNTYKFDTEMTIIILVLFTSQKTSKNKPVNNIKIPFRMLLA